METDLQFRCGGGWAEVLATNKLHQMPGRSVLGRRGKNKEPVCRGDKETSASWRLCPASSLIFLPLGQAQETNTEHPFRHYLPFLETGTTLAISPVGYAQRCVQTSDMFLCYPPGAYGPCLTPIWHSSAHSNPGWPPSSVTNHRPRAVRRGGLMQGHRTCPHIADATPGGSDGASFCGNFSITLRTLRPLRVGRTPTFSRCNGSTVF